MNHDKDKAAKQEIQQQTIKAINRYGQVASIPFQLPGLIALLPAYFANRLVVHHLSRLESLAVTLLVFFSLQLLIGLYFRSFLQKHPDLKWQILIR